jgi:hypothetical protein
MKAIFITANDLKRYSVVNGNVDNDKFMQFIEISQDIHVQNYLGTDLYNKFQTLIIDDTINDVGNAKYKTLLNTYIKPFTIHWALVEYLPYAAYTVANGGVYKHTSETSQTVDKNEIDFLIEKQRDTAQHYTRRFIDFMCFNSSDYPEYNSNSNGDMYPDKSSDFNGWVI